MKRTTINTITIICVVFVCILAFINYENYFLYLGLGFIVALVGVSISAKIKKVEDEKDEVERQKAIQHEQEMQEKRLICPKCGRKNEIIHKELTNEFKQSYDVYDIEPAWGSDSPTTHVTDWIEQQRIRFFRKCQSCSTIYDDMHDEWKEVSRKEVSRYRGVRYRRE